MKCPYCDSMAEWVDNSEVYRTTYGKKNRMIWLCRPCDAYVGCHTNTKRPLGTLAKKELRLWRIRAHNAIDHYWKSKEMTRKQVYARLRELLETKSQVHIGESDEEMCKKIISYKDKIRIYKYNKYAKKNISN